MDDLLCVDILLTAHNSQLTAAVPNGVDVDCAYDRGALTHSQQCTKMLVLRVRAVLLPAISLARVDPDHFPTDGSPEPSRLSVPGYQPLALYLHISSYRRFLPAAYASGRALSARYSHNPADHHGLPLERRPNYDAIVTVCLCRSVTAALRQRFCRVGI